MFTDGKLEMLEDKADADALANSWAALRAERDALLTESDWTQYATLASELSYEVKAEWVSYRESLRDLPETTVDPANPNWPTPPV